MHEAGTGKLDKLLPYPALPLLWGLGVICPRHQLWGALAIVHHAEHAFIEMW